MGAGGAGFPTHVKLGARIDTYICNAAECEPLLFKDQELMRTQAEAMVRGMRLAMEATGAERGVIAIKEKYTRAIEALRRFTGSDIEFQMFGSFYPAGDEYVVVYDVTGRLIPHDGLPLNVGCAVNNVETLINIARAADGQPVVESSLTVTGAVAEPCTVTVPIGVRAADVVAMARGATVDDPVLLDGGAMMGKLADMNTLITKTSGGFIVLPRDHQLIRRRTRPARANLMIAKSACDQCSYCTDFCPRFLLGYAIEPHKVMRSVGFEGDAEAGWAQLGLACCECNLCSLYACPEDLPVMEMCVRSKTVWRERGPRPEPLPSKGVVNPMRDSRRVPISRLIQRLGLTKWDRPAPISTQQLQPGRVAVALSQHIGAPAEPAVAVGDSVSAGQLVAKVPDGKLGAHVHASIPGRVTKIDKHIHIQR